MRGFMGYYGGKQNLASRIVELIPKHTVYVEPFCGGAAIMFEKGLPYIAVGNYSEILNDTNGLLINFYREMQNNPTPLLRKIEYTLLSQDEYIKSYMILKNHKSYNKIEKAWAWYVNINQSFSNILCSGWRKTVTMNMALAWTNRKKEIKQILKRFENVQISNVDALECIKTWDSPQTCFYCDPPYPGSDQGHYKGYTLQNFQELVNCLSEIQGSFLLSCYETKAKIPDEWEKFKFEVRMSSSGKGREGTDRTRKTESHEMGDTERIEIVYRKIGMKIREDFQYLYGQQDQLKLL